MIVTSDKTRSHCEEEGGSLLQAEALVGAHQRAGKRHGGANARTVLCDSSVPGGGSGSRSETELLDGGGVLWITLRVLFKILEKRTNTHDYRVGILLAHAVMGLPVSFLQLVCGDGFEVVSARDGLTSI